MGIRTTENKIATEVCTHYYHFYVALLSRKIAPSPLAFSSF